MKYKKLRSGKKIESALAADLSRHAKEQLREAVYSQFAETVKLPSEFCDVSEEINNKGYLILKIGHDFNEYYEAISGNAKFFNVNTEICGFLKDLCADTEKFIKRKEQNFICKIPEEKIFVNIDRERFCYAVLNIILNASENSKNGGKIRMVLSKTKKFVKITVGDNGFGMDEESLLHCFEPFYSKSVGNKKSKMGLGLTFSRNFVIESGGRINISSEEGKGTTVSMLLPISENSETNLSVESSVPDILGGKFSPVRIVFSALDKD